jgi:hypothetical protein
MFAIKRFMKNSPLLNFSRAQSSSPGVPYKVCDQNEQLRRKAANLRMIVTGEDEDDDRMCAETNNRLRKYMLTGSIGILLSSTLYKMLK